MYSLRSASVSVSRCATSFARFSGGSSARKKGAQSANARMRPMPKSPPEEKQFRGFLTALLVGWIVLTAAGAMYARFKGIPNWAAVPLLAAFLAEYPFYLVPAFPALRERFAGVNLPAYLVVGAVLPYFLACMGASRFEWGGLLRVAALALAMGLWYLVLPRLAAFDVAFLAFFPAFLL